MKIQTTARVSAFSVDDKPLDLDEQRDIDLEFSAIDTGGGFRDAILDFSFSLPPDSMTDISEGDSFEITATLQHPERKDRTATFSYNAEPAVNAEGQVEVNGRLKGEQMTRELIGFMLHLLR